LCEIGGADLRKKLYELFVAYGDVIDVVHMRTPKMRGQVSRVSSSRALGVAFDRRSGPSQLGILDSVGVVFGQAFIVFQDITGATAAMRALNKFEFLGRPLVRRSLPFPHYSHIRRFFYRRRPCAVAQTPKQ